MDKFASSIPKDLFATQRDRDVFFAKAKRGIQYYLFRTLVFLTGLVVFIPIALGIEKLSLRGFPRLIVIVVSLFLYYLFQHIIIMKREGKELQMLSEYLRSQQIRPVTCLLCGYDLKFSKSESCPECGCKLAGVPCKDCAGID